MKKYFIILLTFCFIGALKCQLLSIASSGIPITIVPSATVTNGTTYAAYGAYKNLSSSTLSGVVTINLAINIGTAAAPIYVLKNQTSYTVTALAPDEIRSFNITDNASSTNQYIYGGGTTVVVWPIFNSLPSTTADSSKFEIFILDPLKVNELSKYEESLIKIENPLHSNLSLKYDKNLFKPIDLMDEKGCIIQEVDCENINISQLTDGLYYLRFYNYRAKNIFSKKIIISR